MSLTPFFSLLSSLLPLHAALGFFGFCRDAAHASLHLFFFGFSFGCVSFANEKNFERSEAPGWAENYQEFFALTNESEPGQDEGRGRMGCRLGSKRTKMAKNDVKRQQKWR